MVEQPLTTPVRAADGILYSATGEPYVAEALNSARSSLRHNAVPHHIFAAPAGQGGSPEPGLTVLPFESSGNPYLDKIANMRRSPFERTIYLDTDTYVVDRLDDVFGLLERFELAAALAPGYRGLRDPEVPRAFAELNTGLVAWRAGPRTGEMLRDWQATYTSWLEREPFRHAARLLGQADQPAFRRTLWRHAAELAVLGPEYNYRTIVPGTVVEAVRMIHGRHPDYPALAALLNDTAGPRSFPALSVMGAPPPEVAAAGAAR